MEVLLVTPKIEKTLSSINTNALLRTDGVKVELSEHKLYEITLKNKEGRIIEKMTVPVETDSETQAFLMGYQLALAQK